MSQKEIDRITEQRDEDERRITEQREEDERDFNNEFYNSYYDDDDYYNSYYDDDYSNGDYLL